MMNVFKDIKNDYVDVTIFCLKIFKILFRSLYFSYI